MNQKINEFVMVRGIGIGQLAGTLIPRMEIQFSYFRVCPLLDNPYFEQLQLTEFYALHEMELITYN